ncbi:MAG: MFS transporter [Anaerolineae bacterium]
MTDESTQTNWRRNLYVVWLAEVLAIMGFDAAMPFLPYYVQELGITGPGQVELWTGLLYTANAVALGIMGPIWGSLSDRMGRKLMLARAMFGGALFLGAMGFVHNVYQLLVLRVLQGAVTGTVAASFTLVSASTPPVERAFALGMLQMGVYLGGALGPTVGGFAADLWGYRACFLITGVSLAAGGLLVILMVHEARTSLKEEENDSFLEGLRLVLRSPGVLSVFGVRLLMSAAIRMVNPMLPLFVQALAPAEEKIASLVGVINSANMAATAIGSVAIGRYAPRLGTRRVLLTCLATAAVCYALQGMSNNPMQLLLVRTLDGFVIGGILVTLSTALADAAPDGRQGAVFGLQSTVVSIANAIGPSLGAAVAVSWGLRMPFAVATVGFLLAIGTMAAIGKAQSTQRG